MTRFLSRLFRRARFTHAHKDHPAFTTPIKATGFCVVALGVGEASGK